MGKVVEFRKKFVFEDQEGMARIVVLDSLSEWFSIEGKFKEIMMDYFESLGPTDLSRKQADSLQKKLMTSEAMKVLAIIWKESEFFSDDELNLQNIRRYFEEEEMSQRALGKSLANDAHDVDKNTALVKAVVSAAEPYQLVRKVMRNKTMSIVEATERLDGVMRSLATHCRNGETRTFEQ